MHGWPIGGETSASKVAIRQPGGAAKEDLAASEVRLAARLCLSKVRRFTSTILNVRLNYCAMTDWESCYREDNLPWNKNAPSPPLAEWVKKHRPKGRALVPGCGLGHDVVMLAEAGVDALGLDISATAIDRAEALYPKMKERLVRGNLFDLPKYWLGTFDYVFEHTCLSGMPPELRPRYRDGVASALKPGGLLVGIWYENPDMDPGEAGPPFGVSVAELEEMFAGWEAVEDYVPDNSFPGREGRERVRVLRKPAL
jgi:SAM-dependent methyltransferase